MQNQLSRKLPFWSDSKDDLCRRIASRCSFVKLVLKTRNESYFLEDWLAHHLKIVPPHAIIIFDNMSTDDRVLSIYDNLPEEITVIRYAGFHNYLHVVAMYPELFQALSLSSTYFAMIDSDEFLLAVDDDFQTTAVGFEAFLRNHPDALVFPGTWLANATRNKSIFHIGPNLLRDGRLWGKPVIRSNLTLDTIVLHNSQLREELFSPRSPTGVFVLHMKELYPEQRILINVEKLKARGFCSEQETAAEVLCRDTSKVEDDSIHLYLSEIRRLLGSNSAAVTTLSSGMIRVDVEHAIQFYSDIERQILTDFMGSGRAAF
jgi:hypothetical protein